MCKCELLQITEQHIQLTLIQTAAFNQNVKGEIYFVLSALFVPLIRTTQSYSISNSLSEFASMAIQQRQNCNV